MPDVALRRSMMPVFRRGAAGLALALLALLALAMLVFQTRPSVPDPGPPDAVAAGHTRDVAENLQTLLETDAAAGAWTAHEDELNAVLASAQRLVPGLFGRARVTGGGVVLDLSASAPMLPRGLWANLHLEAAASEQGLKVTRVRLGRLPLPAPLAVPTLRWGLDRALGDEIGTAAVASIAALRVAPPEVTVAFDDAGRVALFERLRNRRSPADVDRTFTHRWWVHEDAERGVLPRSGSVLPYLRHAVGKAANLSRGDDREELKAALYALTLYCGDERFSVVAGVGLEDRMRGDGNHCDPTTLHGRDDLKRHFVISAGLYAATTAGKPVFGMGELKELLDSNEGGSGFSFDDMAADAAGVRFATAFLAAPRSQWRAMLARIRSEDDLLPRLDDLPTRMPEAEFRARYGTVDSPEYAAMLAEIDRRIDALPLYSEAPSN